MEGKAENGVGAGESLGIMDGFSVDGIFVSDTGVDVVGKELGKGVGSMPGMEEFSELITDGES
jgi:hypothetical protein